MYKRQEQGNRLAGVDARIAFNDDFHTAFPDGAFRLFLAAVQPDAYRRIGGEDGQGSVLLRMDGGGPNGQPVVKVLLQCGTNTI